MNQASILPIGQDITKLSGYAFTANDRLGKVDVIIENVGDKAATMVIKEQTSPSGYDPITEVFTVAPRGTITKGLTLLSKKIGFFGSGDTLVNVTTAVRNSGNLRGAQVDIVPIGKKGWGFSDSYDQKTTQPNWGE